MTAGEKNLGFAFFQKAATFIRRFFQYRQIDFLLRTKIYMQIDKQNSWGCSIKI